MVDRDNGRGPLAVHTASSKAADTDTAEPEQTLVVEGYALAPGCWEVWEQLEGEGSKAYEAFTAYRDAGPARSIRAVAQTLAKSLPLLKRWSVSYGWVDRCRRYDMHIDRVARQAVEQQRVDMLTQHASTASKVVALVDGWVDAKLEQLERKSLEDIPDSQIASLMRVAVMVERQSLGLPADTSANLHEHRHTHSADGEQLEEAVAPVLDWVQKLRERATELGIDVEGPEVIDVEPRQLEDQDGGREHGG